MLEIANQKHAQTPTFYVQRNLKVIWMRNGSRRYTHIIYELSLLSLSLQGLGLPILPPFKPLHPLVRYSITKEPKASSCWRPYRLWLHLHTDSRCGVPNCSCFACSSLGHLRIVDPSFCPAKLGPEHSLVDRSSPNLPRTLI